MSKYTRTSNRRQGLKEAIRIAIAKYNLTLLAKLLKDKNRSCYTKLLRTP